MAATVFQIAKMAGVSQPSVSQILNNKGNYKPETRARVLEVARQLRYRPNSYARALTQRRFNAVGMLVSTNSSAGAIATGTLWSIERRLMELDQHLAIGQISDEQLTSDSAVPRLLREWGVDGLLISYTIGSPAGMRAIIDEHQVPSIWINVRSPSDCVYPDDFAGLQMGTRRLLERGHRRIAYLTFLPVSDAGHYSISDRHNGYVAAMREAGLQPQVFPRDPLVDNQEVEPLRQWLASPDRPTAIITYGPREAQVAIYAAALAGIRVPDDLSVVATHSAVPDSLGLPITTAQIPTYAVGDAAVAMLMQKIAIPAERLAGIAIQFDFIEGATVANPN